MARQVSSPGPVSEVSFSCQKPSLSSRFPITPPCVNALDLSKKEMVCLEYSYHTAFIRQGQGAHQHFFKTNCPSSFFCQSRYDSYSRFPVSFTHLDCRYFSSQGHRAPAHGSVLLQSRYWLQPEHCAHHTGAGCLPR